MRKILACVDGSALSGPVVRQAFALADANGAESVEVLHVLDRDVEFPVLSAEFKNVDDQEGKVGKLVQGRIEGLMGSIVDLIEPKVPYRVNVLVGSPYKTIIKRAGEDGFDLVVMGHRGVKGMKRFYLGSVAAKVVAYAPCHVLVLRSESAETPGKVLVAVDGSEWSEKVMGFGLDHALKVGAREVLFLSIIEEPPESAHTYWDTYELVKEKFDSQKEMVQNARERLESILDDLKSTRNTAGITLRTEAEQGYSHATIIEKAESEGTDLVVVGDRGKSGLEGFLLGSVSAKIVRYVPCGVLVYRTGHKKK